MAKVESLWVGAKKIHLFEASQLYAPTQGSNRKEEKCIAPRKSAAVISLKVQNRWNLSLLLFVGSAGE